MTFQNLFKGGIGNFIERPIFPHIENWRKTKLENNIFFWSSQDTSIALSSKKENCSQYCSSPISPRETRNISLRASVYWEGFSWVYEKVKRLIWGCRGTNNQTWFQKRKETLGRVNTQNLVLVVRAVPSHTTRPGRQLGICGSEWFCTGPKDPKPLTMLVFPPFTSLKHIDSIFSSHSLPTLFHSIDSGQVILYPKVFSHF